MFGGKELFDLAVKAFDEKVASGAELFNILNNACESIKFCTHDI